MSGTFVCAALLQLSLSPAGAIDFPNSHDMALGGTPQLSNCAPSTLVNAPGCRIENYLLGLEIGYDRRYDLSDLDHLFVVGAVRHGRFSGALGLAQFGQSELYAERTTKASATYSVRAISFGLTATLFQVEFGRNYGRFHATTFGAGLGYTGKRLRALLVADNLTRPRLMPTAEAYSMQGSLNLEWKTSRNLSTTTRVIKVENSAVRYGLGQRIPLTGNSALLWGISTSPLEYGGGIDIGTRWISFTYAAKIHPVLGFSHNVSILLMRRSHSKPSPGTLEDEFE